MKAARCWTGHPSPPLIAVPFKSPSRVEVMESLLCLFEPPVYGGGVHMSCGVGGLLSFAVLSRVPSGNPKFFPHRTSVVVSFGLLGWALLLPTRLGFVCPFRQLALCCLWKPQVFSQVGSPLANSPGLAFGEPRVFPHMSCVPDSSILFCWIWHFVRGVM